MGDLAYGNGFHSVREEEFDPEIDYNLRNRKSANHRELESDPLRFGR